MMHLSLDAWNTVLTPNKEYTRARNDIVSKLLCVSDDVFYEAHLRVKNKIQSDTIQLISYGPSESFKLLLDELSVDFSFDLFNTWYTMNRYLFLKYPPIILQETIAAINQWTKHNTWGISSNTNFVTGSIINHVITKIINNNGINTYSDLEGVVKPDIKFFDIVKKRVEYKAPNSHIIHIGDDLICDGDGARNANLDFTYCDKPEKLSKIILSL